MTGGTIPVLTIQSLWTQFETRTSQIRIRRVNFNGAKFDDDDDDGDDGGGGDDESSAKMTVSSDRTEGTR